MSFQLQWTRDGVDIPGATNNSYVVQTADRGHTLAFRVVAINSAGSKTATSPGVSVPAITLSGAPSATATVGVAYSFTPTTSGGTAPYTYAITGGSLPAGLSLNTSTGAITGTPTTAQTQTGIVLKVTDNVGATASLAAFTITVANASGTAVTPSTLAAALAAATPGTTLLMAPGDYGNLTIYSVSKAAPGVTLQGQAGVTCNYVVVGGCSNVALTRITVTGVSAADQSVTIGSSDHITIDRFTIAGNNPGAVHHGVGVWARNSSYLTITNNTLSNLSDGIDGLDCQNVTIANNHISKISDNFIFWAGVTTAVIEKNYLANLDFLDPGVHPDTIQIAGGSLTARSSNVTIRYNNFDAMTGVAPQGIGFCEDTDNLTITGNCVFGAMDNGTAVARCTNVTITDNFEQGWTYSPRIYCRGGSDTVNMTGNSCASAPFALVQAGEAPCTNVVSTPNTLIANATGPGDTGLRNTWLSSHPLVPTS